MGPRHDSGFTTQCGHYVTVRWGSERKEDLGICGVSFLETMTMFEHWTSHRLLTENVVCPHTRLILNSLALDGRGVEFRHVCQFTGSLFRSQTHRPDRLAGFLPCFQGAHYSCLGYSGWTQCGHGLSSWPRDSGFRGVCTLLVCSLMLHLTFSSSSFCSALLRWTFPPGISGVQAALVIVSRIRYPVRDDVDEIRSKRYRR